MDREPHLYATDRYEDITAQLRSSASTLGPGGVKLAPRTRLADTLPAFQIGTAKVDTGSPREFRELQFEVDGASANFALDSEQHCVELMDMITRAEMAWHKGFSLIQTLGSCLAIEHELTEITRLKFGGEMLADLVGSDAVGGSVLGGPTAEPPALSAHLAQWQGLHGLLNVFLWSVIRGMAQCMAYADTQADTVFPEEDFHATRYGLYYLDDTPLQQIVEMLERARKQSSEYPQIAERLALRVSWLTVLKQGIPKKLANVDRLRKQIQSWQPISGSHGADASAWFSTGCQSRLNMACLRQQPVTLDADECKQLWLAFVDAVAKMAAVHAVDRSTDLLAFYLSFSSRQEPPIVRAMAKSLFSETQILSRAAKHWAHLDISETMPPPGLPSTRALDAFVAQAALCYSDLLNVFCQNRCRFREGLQALVVSFDSLQVVAEQVDQTFLGLELDTGSGKIPALYLSSWTYFRKLQVMLWSVLLAFETEVVAYGEMASTAWYAFRLCQMLLAQLGRMRSAFEQQGNDARESPGYSFLVALELESQTLSQLCTAQYMLWIALHKLAPPPEPANVSAEMRFRLRFAAFESVGVPEMLEYSEFSALSEKLDVTLALQAAGNAAQSVRTLLATLGGLASENIEIPLLQRSAVGLSLAVATAVKLGSAPVRVEIDRKGFHWYFPVPKVTRKSNPN